jgi:hypothetical protein
MLVVLRRVLIGACLMSWSVFVLAAVGVFDAWCTPGPHLARLYAQVHWVVPTSVALHVLTMVVVLKSRTLYAREWALGLLCSASGQVGLWLILAAILDKVEKLSAIA